MTISKFIKASDTLSHLDFYTVFQTIYFLIDKGLINKNAFKGVDEE